MNVGGTEHFMSRFTVKKMREIVPTFTNSERNWIIDSGHGSLLSISDFSVPIKLAKWMVKQIDPLLRQFRLGDKVNHFNLTLVCNILGLQNGTIP